MYDSTKIYCVAKASPQRNSSHFQPLLFTTCSILQYSLTLLSMWPFMHELSHCHLLYLNLIIKQKLMVLLSKDTPSPMVVSQKTTPPLPFLWLTPSPTIAHLEMACIHLPSLSKLQLLMNQRKTKK